jgi:hypothetical protein
MKNAFFDILDSFFRALIEKKYVIREAYEPYASWIIERLIWHKSLSLASALWVSNGHDDRGELGHSLYRHYMDQVANEEFYYYKVFQIYRRFKERNIPFFPLKGPFWAFILYPDSRWRHFGDLDLLVPHHYAESAFDILNALQLKPVTEPDTDRYNVEDHLKRRGELAFSAKNNSREFTVEIHGTLITPTRYRNSYAIDEQLFLEGNHPHTWREIVFHVPPLEEWFLYLVLHGACQHQFKRFISILDMAHFLDHYQDILDWEKIVERTRRWRVEKALYYSLKILHLFRESIPSIQPRLATPSLLVHLQTSFLKKKTILFATERSGGFRRKLFRRGIT